MHEEIQGADGAHDLQCNLGWPSDQALIKALKSNKIMNYPTIDDDLKWATIIYRLAVPILKGQTTRRKAQHIHRVPQVLTISPTILHDHQNLVFHIDFCFINNSPYLITITDKVNFWTIARTAGQGKLQILSTINPIIKQHMDRGFTIGKFHANNEFNKLSPGIAPIKPNICWGVLTGSYPFTTIDEIKNYVQLSFTNDSRGKQDKTKIKNHYCGDCKCLTPYYSDTLFGPMCYRHKESLICELGFDEYEEERDIRINFKSI